MALPAESGAREKRLVGFAGDINRLAVYIQDNYPGSVEAGGEAVDIAMRIMNEQREKLNHG